MEDASTDCHFRKSCPSGMDNECVTAGRCFTSEACDTNKGHGNLVEEFPAIARGRYDVTNYRYMGGCACVLTTHKEMCSRQSSSRRQIVNVKILLEPMAT